MNRADAPVLKDLVLVGGGHSHVAVLKNFGMHPMPGVRITLICKDAATPYSGMIPGYIAGHYTHDEAHIDLRQLCQFAQAAFYHDAITGLDLAGKRVLCANRPPVSFDLLSINSGSTPRARDIPGATQYALPVKPIERLLQGWEQLVKRALAAPGRTWRIAIVGGGAGGVELTLSIQHRLLNLLAGRGEAIGRLEFHLVTDSATILPTHNARVRAIFSRLLLERNVQVHLNHRVVEVRPDQLVCDPGATVAQDVVFWVTNASAPAWITEAGLQTDANGFIAVNDGFQSLSHPSVFAAGDIAAVLNHPRPKSGVFAVRQGRPLARNLRLALAGRPPVPFTPQKRFLSLISTGNKYAVASRGVLALEGEWVWRLKDWIDRRWMRTYQELPAMETREAKWDPALAGPETQELLASAAARCGGCGAKVGSTTLARVLQRLRPVRRDDVLVGLHPPDDAAVVVVPPGKAAVQTVDFFRSFVSDPFLFGRIAANHCLGDIFAMGAEPQSALAVATIPFGREEKMEEQLYQVMAGAMTVLEEQRIALAGGHTSEGAELAFGLVVNGIADPDHLLKKSGMRHGDRLILTKPLGTGTLFAADMRRQARSAWIEAALTSMSQSSREAARCFLRHQATACTDVTGFGLLGHLAEMTSASAVAVELHLNALPILEGALESVRRGIFSSLQPQNLRLRRAIANVEDAARCERYPILFDPQTAGGLLASVPAAAAEICLAELKQAGCAQAAIIGVVGKTSNDSGAITIRG